MGEGEGNPTKGWSTIFWHCNTVALASLNCNSKRKQSLLDFINCYFRKGYDELTDRLQLHQIDLFADVIKPLSEQQNSEEMMWKKIPMYCTHAQ